MVALAIWILLFVTAPGLTATESVAEEVSPQRAENGSGSNDALRAYLQLQEQIHGTQLLLERQRKEAQESVTALKEAVLGQRERELNAMQSTNQLLLRVAAGFGVVGFLAMVVTAYLQWRAVTRLAEVASMLPAARTALPAPAAASELQLLGAGAAEQSSQRLFGALSQLEKRILELEHTARPAVSESAMVTSTGTNGNDAKHALDAAGEVEAEKDHDSILLAKAQSLLDLDKASEAVEVINGVLAHEPENAEALVKKGMALEQLRQVDQALECYDRAIGLNEGLTIAYLQKGGLFNRLERYEEALKCYELALKAQERAHHA